MEKAHKDAAITLNIQLQKDLTGNMNVPFFVPAGCLPSSWFNAFQSAESIALRVMLALKHCKQLTKYKQNS